MISQGRSIVNATSIRLKVAKRLRKRPESSLARASFDANNVRIKIMQMPMRHAVNSLRGTIACPIEVRPEHTVINLKLLWKRVCNSLSSRKRRYNIASPTVIANSMPLYIRVCLSIVIIIYLPLLIIVLRFLFSYGVISL